MKEVLALWRMELSRVDEQLGDKETDSEFSSSPMFSEEISDFPKKGHGAEAIGAITELLMATGRTPAFQAAVEAWLNMYREEGLLCCERWIPETQKANKFRSTSTSFRKFVRTLSQSFGGQKLQWHAVTQELTWRRQKSEHILFPYYFATHVYKVDALCTRSLGIVHSSCTSWTQAFGRSTATCRKLLFHQTLTYHGLRYLELYFLFR